MFSGLYKLYYDNEPVTRRYVADLETKEDALAWAKEQAEETFEQLHWQVNINKAILQVRDNRTGEIIQKETIPLE